MNTQTQEIVEAQQPNTNSSIINVIERAATNPNVDIDKMERLLEMQERIMARDAEAAYNVALAEMQPNLPAITPKGIGHNKIKYAKWEDIQSQVTPILAQYGFALSFKTDSENNQITVTAILRHKEGHSDQTSLPLPSDTSGNKNNVQAVGSSVSYGKRYTATALLNLNVAGEDDDANLAGKGEFITAEQLSELSDKIADTETDIQKFCTHFKIKALAELPLTTFGAAMKALERKANNG